MGIRQFREFLPNEFIVIGVDCAMGGADYSTATFLSKTSLDVPFLYHKNVLATSMTNELLPILERIYDQTGIAPVIAYERNNGGVFEIERLATLNRAQKFRIYLTKNVGTIDNPVERKLGWDTNSATRPKMLADLKEAIDNQLLTIYDKPTISEMYSFIINSNGKPVAETGSHDDLVMSHAIAWQLAQTEVAPVQQMNHYYNKKKWAIG
jgi:hypothetical protein